MEYTVRIHKKDKVTEKKVKQGTNLLDFLRKNGVEVSSPCGGKGTCGKCRVRVDGLGAEPGGHEKKALGDKALEKGYRLACYHRIDSALDIYTDEAGIKANIVTSGEAKAVKVEPFVTKECVTLKKPDISDQQPDIERVVAFLGRKKAGEAIGFLKALPGALRRENFKVTLVHAGKRLIAVEPGDTTGKLFGIAVDIGTTTVAAYLVDLGKGEKTDVYSVLNPQAKYGADVISRIQYTLASEEALNEMHLHIIDCINRMMRVLTERNGISGEDVYMAGFVGNTTMLHFLMGLPAGNMAVSPFIPVTTRMYRFSARELGIGINPGGIALVMSGVSAYIGADTVAAVLASGMHKREGVSLLIDIGTNGEIVLGNKKWMIACSTAAGPAFEGAHLRNGVGGINGAIDRVDFEPELKYSTIGGEKAIGICGSGVVDAIAGMVAKGITGADGRIIGPEEIAAGSAAEALKDRLVSLDGMNAFLLLRSEEGAADMDLAVTQKDVREFQNAKAAIAAGIKILVEQAGIRMEDIENVYLAGGFGSFVNTRNAVRVGMIPERLEKKIKAIGNAAGEGAVEALLSFKALKQAEKIRNKIQYIELSAYPDFLDEYVMNMRLGD